MDPGAAAAEALDTLAVRLFDGAEGRARLAPLEARFTREVGAFPLDEPWSEAFVTARLDAALVELPREDGGAPWARAVASGEVPGVAPDLGRACLRAVASVFEVRAGRRPVAADCIGGAAAPLVGAIFPYGSSGLYEIRVVAGDGRFHAVRPPSPLPPAARPLVERLRDRALATGRRPSLAPLRRGRLALLRNPRLPPERAFGV